MKKVCSKCKVPKELIEFSRSKKDKYGVQSRCKICDNEARKQWTTNNREHTNRYSREYKRTEKSKLHERTYSKKYTSTLNGRVTYLLKGAKARSKRKNLPFDMDRQWLVEHLVNLKCEATGLPLSLEKDSRYYQSPYVASLDRIDPKKGYTKDNCQIVSVIYNKAKGDSPAANVLLMAQCLLEKSNG